MKHLLPLASIVVGERFRKDYGDVDSLADSIRTYGLLQPLLIDEHNNLIDGGRRYAACRKLNLTDVPCYVRTNIPAWLAKAMELEANLRRKDMTWQEKVIAIADTHELHKRAATLDGEAWGMLETAELLGVSNANVWYCTHIADRIRQNDTEIVNATGLNDAYKLLVERRARKASEELQQRTAKVPVSVRTETLVPPTPVEGEPIISRTVETPEQPVASGLTVRLDNLEAIDYIERLAASGLSVDHVYTDPPYGIDMDNLQQQNTGLDVATVRATHDVMQNVDLLARFCKVVPTILKPTSYCILWCDQDWAGNIAAWLNVYGLRVQRWPITWVKTSACQNGAAYVNFTKTTEIAIVAAMPKASLYQTCNQCHWIGPSDKPAHTPTNPFWKPLALHEWIITHIAAPGSIICDPFAGSGSIPLAAIRCGRSTFANEMDPLHYQDLQKRMK